ncbi:unnamed protein product [Boreogadus saida]
MSSQATTGLMERVSSERRRGNRGPSVGREREEEEVEGGGREGPTAVSPDLARDRPSGPTDVMGEGLWKATRPTSSSGAPHRREGETGSYGDR